MNDIIIVVEARGKGHHTSADGFTVKIFTDRKEANAHVDKVNETFELEKKYWTVAEVVPAGSTFEAFHDGTEAYISY